MNMEQEFITRREFIRDKHHAIYQRYLELMRKESVENPLRARHISKMYYAMQIAQSMTPTMDANYILRVINNVMRNDYKD